MNKFVKYWVPVLLWAGFIFLVSSLSGPDIPRIFSGQEIVFHIFEYTILALFLSRAIKNSRYSPSNRWGRLFLSLLICLVYASSDELHQGFVPGRVGSLTDVIIDSLGIVLGSVIYR